MRAALYIIVGRLVRVDIADPGTALDRHIANRHPLFDRHRLDDRTGVFITIADPAIDPKLADDMQDHVLGIDSLAQATIDDDAPHLELVHRQALGGQHVADLAGTNTEGHRAEGSVRRSMAITAGDRHTRLGKPQLRADNVHHALALVVDIVERDFEFARILLNSHHHLLGQIVDKRPFGQIRGHNMVHRGECALGHANFEAAFPEHLESLGAGHFVYQMQTDEKLSLPRGQLAHRMLVPSLV